MKRICFLPVSLLSLLVIWHENAKCQQTGVITGVVKDQSGAGLPSVTISLINAKDSIQIKAGLSSTDGSYEISPVTPGLFMLCYSHTGFETRFSTPIELKDGQVYQMPDISLQAIPGQLKEVTVTVKKPLIEVKQGKTIVNVQNSISATGSHALELLQNSPGIIVDNNDNISMKGKLGVRVYIDGKLLQLNTGDLAAYLRSINSHDIETIEMINSPGARYDASGNAGVINIRMRKNTNAGTNGSITTGIVQGITPKGNGAFNLNYRNRKINIFSHAGISIGRHRTEIIAPRTQKDTAYDQRLLQVNYNQNYNVKAGIDYIINSKQTLGVIVNSGFNNDDWASNGQTDIYYQPSRTYVKRLDALNEIPRKRTNINSNFNYVYADTAGLQVNFDANYGLFRGRAKSYQPNYYTDHDGNLLAEIITRNSTPTDIDIYTSRLDIVLPLQNDKLEFGLKYSYVKTNNILDFYIEDTDIITKIAERSFGFIYKEAINAAYISYDRKINSKWIIHTGLRAEQTKSKGVLQRGDGAEQADSHVEKDYLDFFPNAVLTWNASTNNKLTLIYNRRIDRPNYQQLNPFELKLDELSYVKGNSFLRPQYTHSIELSHTWKNKVNSALSFSYVNDLTTQTVDTLDNYTYAMAKNLATQQIANASINVPLVIGKWWNGLINLWTNYQVFKGRVNEHTVKLKAWGYGAFTQHSFTLGREYTAELSGWLNGPTPLGPTLISKSFGAVDIGFQKVLMQKKATIKVSATDIFRTAVPFRAKTDFGGVLLNFWVTRESRTVRVYFTYRFGNNKIKTARQRQLGLETESKRIQEN